MKPSYQSNTEFCYFKGIFRYYGFIKYILLNSCLNSEVDIAM